MEKQSKNTGTVVVTWPSDFERGQEEREYQVAKSNLPGVFCRCHGCDDIFLVLGAVCSSCGVVANYVLGDGAQGGKVWACDSCQMGVSTVECECGTENSHANMKEFKEDGTEACFVATVCFGDLEHPVVCELRLFRDQFLQASRIGRCFIRLYYRYGPYWASVIDRVRIVHPPIRLGLRFVALMSRKLKMHR